MKGNRCPVAIDSLYLAMGNEATKQAKKCGLTSMGNIFDFLLLDSSGYWIATVWRRRSIDVR